MTHFYRYLQPLLYDKTRMQVFTPQKGGICFRVETNKERPQEIKVSYSLCDDDTNFDKEVARKIADTRFSTGNFISLEVESVATNVIALAIMDYWHKSNKEECTKPYLKEDLTAATLRIMSIRGTHFISWQLEKLYHDTTKAMRIEQGYNEKSQVR